MTTTAPTILDGKWLSGEIQKEISKETALLFAKYNRKPGLGVILVGDNPASQSYVASKEKLALACGLATFDQRLPSDATFLEVIAAIQRFNEDPLVDGILLQLPLPKHLVSQTNAAIDAIDPAKDADGLHPHNQGLLMRGEGKIRPCTPLGVMKMIDVAIAGVPVGEPLAAPIPSASLAGKQVAVIGRSILVGKPVALLLLERNATVQMLHSKSGDLPRLTREADIVVAAVGVPKLVGSDWIRDGAIVIDVGINRTAEGKLVGDVDFDAVKDRTSAITPVPKGVGPMTVVMLLQNTVNACKQRLSQ